jgi:hypothetical protein
VTRYAGYLYDRRERQAERCSAREISVRRGRVLEHAAETGSAQANFMLAETYDPSILSTWGTYGTRDEATKARALYAKAYAGGIQEAKTRFDALDIAQQHPRLKAQEAGVMSVTVGLSPQA